MSDTPDAPEYGKQVKPADQPGDDMREYQPDETAEQRADRLADAGLDDDA